MINIEKLPVFQFHLSPMQHRYIKKTISKAPVQYDTDYIDIGDILRYFRYILLTHL